MLLPSLVSALHTVVQEDGSHPGQGFQAWQTVLYFVVAPIALFVGISVIALATSGDRKKTSSSLTHIE
ncbi:MAG: hypothetical protein WCH42_06200 [Actinomycetes bacterium]